MKRCLLILVLLLTSISTFAQNNKQDVVYLKNGSIIRGEIVNLVPNEAVKIKTADGSVFAYAMDEVKEITKEPAVKPEKKNRIIEKRKGYIGLSLGPSIPLGNYANAARGNAETGIYLGLVNFGYLFSDHLGITATFFSGANTLKHDDYNGWGYGGLMVGPLLSQSFSSKLELDLRPMIGFASAIYPYNDYEDLSNSSFAYNIGAMLRMNVGRRFALLVHADFFSTKPNFEYYDIQQRISTLNLGFGIAYRLR